MKAWLVWYSENEIWPICLFFEPQFPEDYFQIEEVTIIRNINE
jgi:hypothetical protein